MIPNKRVFLVVIGLVVGRVGLVDSVGAVVDDALRRRRRLLLSSSSDGVVDAVACGGGDGGGDGGDGGDGGGNKQEPTTTATTSNSADKTLSDDLPSFTLDELQNPTTLPVDIDRKNREEYLSSVDFQSIMGISKSDFIKLPQWKRNAAKKKVGLF